MGKGIAIAGIAGIAVVATGYGLANSGLNQSSPYIVTAVSLGAALVAGAIAGHLLGLH